MLPIADLGTPHVIRPPTGWRALDIYAYFTRFLSWKQTTICSATLGGIRPTGQHGPASVWGDDARRPRTVFKKGCLKMSLLIPVYRLQLVRGIKFRTDARQIHGPQDAAALLSAYPDGADRESFYSTRRHHGARDRPPRGGRRHVGPRRCPPLRRF